MIERDDRRLQVGEADLATATWGTPGAPPDIVMLHDGLGSIDQWRDVPERIAAITGLSVLAYERPGHGSSLPIPTGPWPTRWLHHEAERLDAVLEHVGAQRPLVVGHSDGGSIALIAAMNGVDMSGLVSIAAHTWVEGVCRAAIVDMRAETTRFTFGLSRHHHHPAALFEAWSGVWVSREFGRWDIRPELHAITVPTVVAQGDHDEYATDAMVTDTVAAIGDNATAHFIAGGKHIVHHHDPDAVVDLVADAVDHL
ncbi:MAG: alpha/beta fold hydrolase [Ilumatobacter sp.]